MKKVVILGLAAAFLVVTFVRWHARHAVALTAATSSSQIFIHGTPVCVFTQDGNIVARVGQCPDAPEAETEGPAERAPFHGQPGMELPPGHPPVDRDMFPDGRRTVPI